MLMIEKSRKKDETPWDTDFVLGMLDSYQASSALCAAMELGLFWFLGGETRRGGDIAGSLQLPENRCRYWLHYLCKLGLLDRSPEGFSVSAWARTAVLDSLSQETWTLLAKESIAQYQVFHFLPTHFHHPGSLWEMVGSEPPDYVAQMNEDPVRARQFTRMLLEIHQQLADTIADLLDVSDVNLLMDLGGGSGVISMALLRRNAKLQAVVVDIPNVCDAGREIAAEHVMEDRLEFHPVDFTRDELPKGFDMVLECDVGVYSVDLFRKLRESLNPGGRFVIIDQFAPAKGVAPNARISWALIGALEDPNFSYPTAQEIALELEKSGYQSVTFQELPKIESGASQFSDDVYMIDAYV
jgi:SAM-dependent methyltransferase